MEKEKFEEMKQFIEKATTKIRDKSIKAMIHREKARNFVMEIQKTPTSKRSQQLIKYLQIDLPSPSKTKRKASHRKSISHFSDEDS